MPKPLLVVVEAAEQRVLADRLVALDVDVLVDGLLVDRDQRPPLVLHVVEGAGLDQRLDHPLVADQRRDLLEEVVEVERSGPSRRAPRRSPSTTLWPTLRIAVRPNRMSLPTGVKLAEDSLTSGGSTWIFIRRHSLR